MDFDLIFWPTHQRYSKMVFTVINCCLLPFIWYLLEVFTSKNEAMRSKKVKSVRDSFCTNAPKEELPKVKPMFG